MSVVWQGASRSPLPGTILWLSLAAGAALGAGGCVPTQPTPTPVLTQPVAQAVDLDTVEPVVLDYSDYVLDHDPNAPGVSVCQTQPRDYCTPAGVCTTQVDLYTVLAPETCPAEPIE